MGKKKKQTKVTTNSKKIHELNIVAKGNLKFKNFSDKRNGSKMVIVRPK